MSFGKNTYGDPIIHWGSSDSKLLIGNYCNIGENVNIYLSGGSIITKDKKWIIPLISCSVTIGNDIWIGSNVTVMPGITIGDGSIISNNSRIVSDIKPYSFVCGNPATTIEYKFNKTQIKQLLKIKWWNWTDERIHTYTPLLSGENVNAFIRHVKLNKN